MTKGGKTYDLEPRLITLGVKVIQLSENLPSGKGVTHLSGQLIRSGTVPALIYGEAQEAESIKDFLHKMKLCLKELRESSICLKMLDELGVLDGNSHSQFVKSEVGELILIFSKSISTAKKNSIPH